MSDLKNKTKAELINLLESVWVSPFPFGEGPEYIAELLWPYVRPIDFFIPDPSNVLDHSDEDVIAMAGGFQKFGQRQLVWVNTRDNVIEAGHKRFLAAKALKWEYLAGAGSDDDNATRIGFMISDNALARQSSWDWETLNAHLSIFDSPYEVPGIDADFMMAIDAELNGKEAGDIDPYDEWEGMPEFEQEATDEPFLTIKIHFANEEDMKRFAALVKQTVTDKTTFLWFPKKPESKLKELAYVTDDVIDES